MFMKYINKLKIGKVMIGKKEFKELIQEYFEQNKRIDKLYEIFPDPFGDFTDWGFRMFDKVINSYFDNEGVDWVNYYLYDNPKKCYYQDGAKISLETVDDLWLLIESHRK